MTEELAPRGFEYAAAPESRAIVSLDEAYGLFVGGEPGASRRRRTRRSRPPTRSRSRWSGRQACRTSTQRSARRATPSRASWSALRPAERAKYLFRIARLLQERAREFAVLESLNGGKPIKESRDVDLPLAAAHFFYYAGWADKLDYAFPNRSPAAGRRGRARSSRGTSRC